MIGPRGLIDRHWHIGSSIFAALKDRNEYILNMPERESASGRLPGAAV